MEDAKNEPDQLALNQTSPLDKRLWVGDLNFSLLKALSSRDPVCRCQNVPKGQAFQLHGRVVRRVEHMFKPDGSL